MCVTSLEFFLLVHGKLIDFLQCRADGGRSQHCRQTAGRSRRTRYPVEREPRPYRTFGTAY